MIRFRTFAVAMAAISVSGCASMGSDDFEVAGPVAPPGKYAPDVYVPEIASESDFLAAAGTNTVFFDTDEAILTPQAREILERQALWLVTHRDVPFKVEGHADERASSPYNLKLGRRRAEAVKDFFLTKGIRSERITIVTFGEESPVVDKYGDVQINRRAVTVVAR